MGELNNIAAYPSIKLGDKIQETETETETEKHSILPIEKQHRVWTCRREVSLAVN